MSIALGAPVLVTGCAGFIGMHAALALLAQGRRVTGVDNLDPYYDVTLKEARLARLVAHGGFRFARMDLADADATGALFEDCAFGQVVHLAAQPGVRHSLVNPGAYFTNNLTAFGHVIEGCRQAKVAHLVYASSSSVYGANHSLPFSEDQNVDHPVSLYAATKKANELIAHSYSHLYRLPTTGLRFFTVYGPWGRPDMAPMLFTKAILAGHPIRVFNDGNMRRDFTYVDDIVEGIVRVMDKAARWPTATPRRTRSTTSAITKPSRWRRSLPRSSGCSAGPRSANMRRCSRATCRPRTPRSIASRPSPASRRTRRSPTASHDSCRGTGSITHDFTETGFGQFMILVTGGAGFIGANFVLDWLEKVAEPVVNLDKLTYAGNLGSLAELRGDARHLFVRGDIGDRAQVDALLAQHRPRAIVNFAAESHVDRSIHGPAAFVDTNVVGTFHLLEAARSHWAALPKEEGRAFRFLHVSTDEVYGSLGPERSSFHRDVAPMRRTARTRRRRRRPTTWCAPTITRTGCPRSRPIARTITARASFRKS